VYSSTCKLTDLHGLQGRGVAKHRTWIVRGGTQGSTWKRMVSHCAYQHRTRCYW